MIKQVSVFLENSPGSLFKVASILAKADVDIRAITMAENSDFALLRIVVNDPDRAVKTLEDNGIAAIQQEVIAVGVDDKPGGLASIADVLAKGRLNIEYVYTIITRAHKKAFVILRTDDIGKTEKILVKNGVHILDKKELYEI